MVLLLVYGMNLVCKKKKMMNMKLLDFIIEKLCYN